MIMIKERERNDGDDIYMERTMDVRSAMPTRGMGGMSPSDGPTSTPSPHSPHIPSLHLSYKGHFDPLPVNGLCQRELDQENGEVSNMVSPQKACLCLF